MSKHFYTWFTCCLFALLTALPMQAQDDCVTIGTGTTSGNYTPICGWYHNCYTQQLYLANEIDHEAADITSIAFAYTATTSTTRTISIYMAHTDATSLTTTFISTDLQEVLPPTVVTFDNSAEWSTIELTTPFEYDGSSNLVVAVYMNYASTETNYANLARFAYTTATGMASYKTNDTAQPNQLTLVNNAVQDAGTVTTNRPNVQFCFTASGGATCAKPSDLTLGAVTGTTASFSWTPSTDNETEWTLLVKNGNDVLVDNVTVTSPNYTVTDLEPGTNYSLSVKVTHTCDAETSATLSKSLSFTTTCATITSFPWKEYFENDATGDLSKPCWTNEHVISVNDRLDSFKIYSTTSTTYTGGNSTHILQYPDMQTGNTARLTLPEMNIPAANTYEFVISVYRPSVTTESYLKEGIFVVAGTDTLAFIPRGYQSTQGTKEDNALYTVPAETADGWYNYRFTLPNAGVQHISLYGRSCYGSSTYIDSLRVRKIPTCWPTKAAWVEDITTNSAKLVWNEASTPGDYHVVVKYGTTIIADQVVSDTTLVVTGLTPATTYSGVEVSITTVCSATDSSEPFEGAGTFMTECELIEFTEEELTFDFESLATGYIHNYPCWDTLRLGAATNYWYVSTTAHTGSRSVYCTSMTAPKKVALIFPGVDLPENYEISAWVKESSHYAEDTLWFYVNNQPSMNGATLVGAAYDMSTSWTEFRKPMTGQEGATYVIVVSHARTSLYLDDVTLRPAPNCFPVPAAEFALLEDNSIKLTWTPGAQETKWKVTLEDVEGYIQGDDYENIIVEDTPELLLEDLLEANVKDTLHVSIVAVCGEGNESEEVYTNDFAFHTPAAPAALPYENDFSNEEENTAWININVAANAWYTGEAAHEEAGNGALYVSNDGGVTNAYTVSGTQFAWAYRALNFEEAGDYELSFDWIGKGESSFDGMIVIIVPANVIPEAASSASCKVGELTSFSKSTTIAAAAEKGYILLENPLHTSSYDIFFNNVAEWQVDQKFNISIATPGVYNLCFGWVQDSSGGSQPAAAVDNLSIAKKACSATPEPSILSIGTDSVVIGWESKHDLYAYSVKEGTTVKAESASFDGSTIVIGGLTPATDYSYEVTLYGICDEQNADTVVLTLPFTTGCLPIAELPWSENFNSYTGSTSSTATTGYPNDKMPSCWTFLNRSETSSTYPQVFISSNSGYPVSGNCLFFKSSSEKAVYAILPEFSVDLSTQQIVFTYRNEGVSEYNGTLHVGYMTGISEDTYVDLYEFAQTTTKTEVEVGLSTIPAGARVAFKYVGGINNNYYMAIDNISLQPLPTCFPTTEAVVDTVTTNSMTLLWNTPKVEGTYHVLLKKDTTVLADEVLSDTMLVVSGLVPGTVYKDCDLKITTICSEADTSKVFSKKISFTTACEVVSVLPWSQGFEDYAGTTYNVEGEVPACWDAYSAPATVVKPHVVKSGTYAYIHGGTKSLAFYGNGANYVVLPEFTAALNTLQISFWRRMESASNGALELGYITAADENLNTFVRIDSLTNSTSYTIYEKFLDDVPAEAAHLVLKWSASTQYACCIDDITIDATPTCRKPLSLSVDTFTYNSVSLSWEVAHNEPQFQIAVLPADSALTWEGAQIVTGTSATINGLTPETPYKVTFRAYCSAEDQSEVRTAIFTTYPSCYVPTNLAINALSSTSATLVWKDAHAAGSYAVAYGLASTFDLTNAETYSIVEAADTFAVLTGLQSASVYKAAVKATCGADLGDSKYTSAIQFITDCDYVTALPWLEGFENVTTGSAPICWDNTEGTTTTASQRFVGYKETSSDNMCVRFNSYTNTNNNTNFLKSPEFILPAIVAESDTVFLGFDWKDPTGGAFGVYVMNNAGVIDTLVEGLSAQADWAHLEYSLGKFAGDTVRIVFKGISNYGSGDAYIYLDNISIAYKTCAGPSDIVKGAVTAETASFSWNGGEAASWKVIATVNGVARTEAAVDAPNYVLDQLTANTAYTVQVRVVGVCDGGMETLPTSATFTFRTLMPAEATEAIAPQSTFTPSLNDASEQIKWMILGEEATNHFIFGAIDTDPALYISNNNSSWAYSLTSASGSMACRQFSVADDTTEIRVQFDWQANGELGYSAYDYGRALIVPADAELSISGSTLKINGTTLSSSAVTIDGVYNLDAGAEYILADISAWAHIDQTITLVQAGTYRILFAWRNDTSGGEQKPLGIKNISIANLNENSGGTSVIDIEGDAVQVEKVLRDGQVYIVRDGKIYSIIGTVVR